ncbi:MAG TPA: 2Fe-2S iron-sulfur cluster-binding protein [Candidatus Saccharimonadales bacterium]|nr:2Fe-2S iron-sulfur cluster-binding protein [Candidatus Saccharimonadales bacterium]
MITVSVDGRSVQVPVGALVWDACEKAGVFVPVYCAHKKLAPVAVCRMCLVEVGAMPKLQPACSTTVSDGMEVRTQTERVQHFRQGNLEFLLLNHPLDCPVCDRGGECDLQDFALRYGPGRTRQAITQKVHFNKALRLSEKILLDQERCILCWRCTRYYDEVTGEKELVLQERGVHTVVDTFEGLPLQSDFQGNLPEICPVGALTHAQYRFRARPWDLRRTLSVCPGCSYGCSVNVDTRETEVVRFASSDNPEVDDSWLCDKGRYGSGELNRVDRVRSAEVRLTGSTRTTPYVEAVAAAAAALRAVIRDHGRERVAVLGTPLMTNEEAFLLEWLAREVIGTPHVDHQLNQWIDLSPSEFALGISETEDCDAILVVGEHAEAVAPVLRLRLYKAEHKRGRTVRRVSADGDPEAAAAQVAGARRVGIICHERDRDLAQRVAVAAAAAGASVRRLTITDGVNGRGCKDLGLLPNYRPGYRTPTAVGRHGRAIVDGCRDGEILALVAVGPNPALEADPDVTAAFSAVPLLVAITPVRDVFWKFAEIILPGRTIAEKSGTVTNSEGRVQAVRVAVHPNIAVPSELGMIAALGEGLGAERRVSNLSTAILDEIRGTVPAYAGTAGGLRANWGERT